MTARTERSKYLYSIPIVILSDSEGSHCRAASKHGQRYLATRAPALFYSNNYGARLGMTRWWGLARAVTAPRSVRSPASTLRRISSKSLKHRTREEGAGKGEFAFTECRNFYFVLAQNRGFCAKEEPQAQKAGKPSLLGLLRS